jgi:hypothetical protein
MTELAKTAYNAYFAYVGGKDPDGMDLPVWEAVTTENTLAWASVATAVKAASFDEEVAIINGQARDAIMAASAALEDVNRALLAVKDKML